MPTQDTERDVTGDDQEETSSFSVTEYLKLGNPLVWLRRGVSAVGDQALFAGGNFVLNIFLARWLLPQEYGAYATALTAYTFVIVLHEALLSKPMLVFAAGRFEERFEKYFGTLIYGHVGFCAVAGTALALTSFALPYVVGESVVAPWLSLSVMCPFILLPHFTRKICYAVHKPLLAAQASALYLVVLLVLLYGTHQWWSALTPATAFGIMGGAGLVSGLALVVVLQPTFPRLRWSDGFLQLASRAHWGYGRWTAATGLMGWTPGWIWYIVLPAWVGLEAGGTLRALTNFTLPMSHVLSALGTILVPTFVASKKKSARRYALLFWGCLILLGGAALVYWGLISYFGEMLVAWVYDGKYASQSYLLIILCFVPVIKALTTVADSSLHSSERPDLVFYGSLAAFVLTLTLGLALTYVYGLSGAVWGELCAVLGMVGLAMFFAIRNLRRVYAQHDGNPDGVASR
jgi:O-antigen/teichoic acid export membrane protein